MVCFTYLTEATNLHVVWEAKVVAAMTMGAMWEAMVAAMEATVMVATVEATGSWSRHLQLHMLRIVVMKIAIATVVAIYCNCIMLIFETEFVNHKNFCFISVVTIML
jgi:hypothetical protein